MGVSEKYLPKGKTRNGKPLEIRAIVVHYVGNPGSGATGNWNYFCSNKYNASAHEIIEMDGDVFLCIPENERANHAGVKSGADLKKVAVELLKGNPNAYSYGIELCHEDQTGQITKETREALILRLVYLCKKYNLNPRTQIVRHFDINGKDCPRWFVSNPDEWEKLKKEVAEEMEENWKRAELLKAVDALEKKGILANGNQWKAEGKETEKAELWFVMAILARIAEK